MGLEVVRNLKEIRKRKYAKATDFAKECGLSVKTIHRAESGNGKIGIQSIAVMARALGIKANDLIYKEGEGDEDMGKVKVLFDVISDMRTLADSLEYAAEVIFENDEVIRDSAKDEKFFDYEKARSREDYSGGAEKNRDVSLSTAKLEGKKLEEIRSLMAEKSKAGFSLEVKDIIESYKVSKLCEVGMEFYEEIKKSVESLGEKLR